jgi:hypothetical protein
LEHYVVPNFSQRRLSKKTRWWDNADEVSQSEQAFTSASSRASSSSAYTILFNSTCGKNHHFCVREHKILHTITP